MGRVIVIASSAKIHTQEAGIATNIPAGKIAGFETAVSHQAPLGVSRGKPTKAMALNNNLI